MSATIIDLTPPPELVVPDACFSAPESRVPTPPSHHRKPRNAFSQPTSRITTPSKKPLAAVHRRKPLSPIRRSSVLQKIASPTHAISKHRYHASFATFNPRAIRPGPVCPMGSYVSAEQEIAVLPRRAPAGGVKFGDTSRDLLMPARPTCPVHVYAEAKSTLSRLGGAPMGRYNEREEMADACPVHAYATPPSAMRATHASFATFNPRGTVVTSSPAVHCYSTPRSSLSGKGGATFGGAPARSSLPALSRTGLVSSAAPAPDAPRPSAGARLRRAASLAKLQPLLEADKRAASEAGESSPREVEAMLMPGLGA